MRKGSIQRKPPASPPGVEIDPGDGFALAIYGHTKSLLFRDYAAAQIIFEQAPAASPSNAMAWTLSSGVYAYIGNGKCAIARAEQRLRLSPIDVQSGFHLGFLSQAHYVNRSLDGAIIWGRKTAIASPQLCANLQTLASALIELGKYDEVHEFERSLLRAQPRFRVSTYAERCPFEPRLRVRFLEQLRKAGLPD